MASDQLPALSVANVRVLLQVGMPLPQLSAQEAAELVVEQLVSRTWSHKSRIKKESV